MRSLGPDVQVKVGAVTVDAQHMLGRLSVDIQVVGERRAKWRIKLAGWFIRRAQRILNAREVKWTWHKS